MTESLPSHCLSITNDFISDQLAQWFASLEKSDKKFLAEYNAKVKNPIDLSTIKKKIKDNLYSSYQEWIDDMYLVFDNAVTFHEATSLFGGVAIYLKKQFNKKLLNFEGKLNSRNYEDQLIDLSKKIEQLLKEPPLALNIVCKIDMDSPNSEEFTFERMMNLQSKLSSIAANGGRDKIIQCICETNSEYNFSQTNEIDISHLGRRTLQALEKLE